MTVPALRPVLAALFGAALGFAPPAPVSSEPAPPAAAPGPLPAAVGLDSAPPARPPLTAADLEPFLDGVVPLALATNDVAGAVVVVVKDGALLLAKGYGYADVEHRLPVRPDSTLFRVASISKVFTATAVMQLVEAGRLDLDQDVNGYLDFELPRRFPEPITLRHLLTHTAGFEESFKQLPTDSGRGVPLREWITKMTPAQIYRPGTVTSYSNYGADLAGYIVQVVSGEPYADYIRVHILEPLGMRQSSMAEPLPAALRAHLSREYPSASEPSGEFEVLQGEPSGNLSATGADMARFALAHLGLGRLGEVRILQDSTARLMATTQFRTHPDVPGMGLGFFEESRNGHRIIGHGGDLARFHSHLSLLMDEGVGFFIAVNSSGRGSAFYGPREAVRDAFLDRYFPRTTPLEPALAGAVERSRRYAGAYTLSRRGETGMGRLAGLLVDLSVRATDDGSVEIPFVTGPSGRPMRWYPIDATVFRSADGSQRIGYVAAGGGLPDRFGFLGGHELHRVAAWDGRGFNLPLVFGFVAVFASALVLWPVAALIRRRAGRPVDDGVGRGVRILTRVGALAALAFLVGLGVFLMMGFGGGLVLDRRLDPVLAGIRLIGLVGALATIASITALVHSLRRGRNGWARFKYASLVAAGIAFTWFAIHWNLLAWSFRY